VAPGKGILAADESTGTIGKRFEGISEYAPRLGGSPRIELRWGSAPCGARARARAGAFSLARARLRRGLPPPRPTLAPPGPAA